ncbi:MAG TPA: LacI family DNA-binding transcriptional regulator [Candidatus Angelobacter sp.]|jgi:LacI family transcriptional regulator|nr:LacI family DNA-binding transcriptional regulator [Candidatus Angelobacter sp.]
MPGRRVGKSKSSVVVNLKVLADYLNLTPGTISVVLNGVPRASEIPQETQDRIFAAARKLNYRPNHIARSLKNKRSYTVGILAPEVSEGYGALLLNAIGEYLIQQRYFYFVATHRRRPDLLEEYSKILMERSVDGFIIIDTALEKPLPLPAVAISGHTKLPDLTNIILDHDRAATLALKHLAHLGHKRIVFMKGQPFSADSEERWRAIQQAAPRLGIRIFSELTLQLTMDTFSPLVAYPVMQEFLKKKKEFTAVFAYNDFSAIGAIRSLREAGFRIPEDVSVVGFDDINSAAFQNPSLTTIRQPLQKMAEIAAQTLLDRLNGREVPKEILVEPELIVRESTGTSRVAASKELDGFRAALKPV